MHLSAQQLKLWLLLPLFLITLSSCASMLETKRNVFVNHERQNSFGAAAMDQKVGFFMPDGDYWVDWVSGNWGIEGSNKILGNVHATAAMATARANNQRSSSSGGGGSGSLSPSQNGLGGTGKDAQGRNCAFVSIPNGSGMMSCH